MIWFFLAGWISGAAFMIMYARHWMRKHTKVIKLPLIDEENENEQKDI